MARHHAKLIITDEINCYFTGLPVSMVKVLERRFQLQQPGARHTPAYKLGRWDGYVKLFNNGQFYVNLIDQEFLQLLDALRISIEVDDRRQPNTRSVAHIDANHYSHITFKGAPMVLRDVQVDMVNSCVDNPSGMIIAATGAGKTAGVAGIVDLYKDHGRVMVVVPSIDLVTQTLDTFRIMGLPDIGEFDGNQKCVANIIVGTWQSLIRYPEAIEGVKCLIADECHEYEAKQMFEFLTTTARDVPFRYGFTGTMPKDELSQRQLKVILGDVLMVKAAHELQAEGILANCHIDILQTKEDENIFFGDYHDEHDYLLAYPPRRQWMVDLIKATSTTGNSLVIVDTIELGKHLAKSIPNSVFINGTVASKKRMEQYKRLDTENGLTFICTSGVIKRGIDVPRIFNVFLVEMGKKYTRIIQMIGRGLRRADDKTFLNIFDLCANTKHSKLHLTERKRFYRESKYPYDVTKVTY